MNKNLIVGKYFKLGKKLGSGAFGEIYKAKHSKTNEEAAVKLEDYKTQFPQLYYEAKLYKYFHKHDNVIDIGIPRVYYYNTEGKYNILVMDLLGPSLENLFVLCGKKFSLKTVCMLAEQMITRIEFCHNKYFLHRDIKPDNFLIGYGKKSHKIYIIDFGLAKRYIQKDGSHIKYREGKSLTGTARYATINTHRGIEQGRRDDLESLGYVILYFLKKKLPWQSLPAKTKEEKYHKIMKKKIEYTCSMLCKGLPQQFYSYFKYCRKLQFIDKPDYKYLKSLFKEVMRSKNYEFDYQYDWLSLKAFQAKRIKPNKQKLKQEYQQEQQFYVNRSKKKKHSQKYNNSVINAHHFIPQ